MATFTCAPNARLAAGPGPAAAAAAPGRRAVCRSAPACPTKKFPPGRTEPAMVSLTMRHPGPRPVRAPSRRSAAASAPRPAQPAVRFAFGGKASSAGRDVAAKAMKEQEHYGYGWGGPTATRQENNVSMWYPEVGITTSKYITFVKDVKVEHEVSVVVDASPAKCYDMWRDRAQWMRWVPMIRWTRPAEDGAEGVLEFEAHYRLALLPRIELHGESIISEDIPNERLVFESKCMDCSCKECPVPNFPHRGVLTFAPEDGGKTRVSLEFQTWVPDCIVLFNQEEAATKSVKQLMQKFLGYFALVADGTSQGWPDFPGAKSHLDRPIGFWEKAGVEPEVGGYGPAINGNAKMEDFGPHATAV